MRTQRMIRIAERKITGSMNGRAHRVGAVIAKGSRILSHAENTVKPRFPFVPKGVCSPLL